MKILIPILSLSPHGGNRVLTEIANSLVGMGHEVKVISGDTYKNPTYVFDPRVQVEIIYRNYSKVLTYLNLVIKIPSYVDQGWIPLLNHAITFSYFLFPKDVLMNSVIILQGIDWRNVMQPYGLFIKIGGLMTLRRHRGIVSANSYLTHEVNKIGNDVIGEMKLGISSIFFNRNYEHTNGDRDIDILFFGRPQKLKRLDFYIDVVKIINGMEKGIRIAVASKDTDVIRIVGNIPGLEVYEPKNDIELRSLYERSHYFLLASSHEGFSLPPLEAMGSGCIPIITECGGPSVYAQNGRNSFVIPRCSTPKFVADFCIDKVIQYDSFYPMIEHGFNTAKSFIVDNNYNAELILSAIHKQCEV